MMSFEVCLPNRPDFFRNHYSAPEYDNILKELSLAKAGAHLCLGETGLTTAGKVYTFFQQIKEFFGFENLTSKEKTNAECLKLLFYGATKGFQNSHYVEIFDKIQKNQLKVSDAVRNSFELLAKSGEITKETKLKLRDILNDYCTTHRDRLKPANWTIIDPRDMIRLPLRPYFGDTYIAQAEIEMSYSKNVTQSVIKKYEAAAEWGPYNSEYSARLVNSWYNCLFKLPPSDKKQAEPLNLMLANRQYNHCEYASATRFFDQIESLDSKQLTCKMLCYFKLKEYKEVEKCLIRLEETNLLPEFHQDYAKIYLTLGDFYKEKIGTLTTKTMNMITLGSTPSDEDHKKKALRFYVKRAILSNDPSVLAKTIDEMALRSPKSSDSGLTGFLKTKVKATLGVTETKSPPPEHEFVQLAEQIIEDRSLISAYLLIIAIRDENDFLLTYNGPKILRLFTKAIRKCLENGIDNELCIDLIGKVLKTIGAVDNYFNVKREYVSYISYETKKTIVPECNHFVKHKNSETDLNILNVDMGASLHFLKAELMTLNPAKYHQGDILEEYNLAVRLAPKNPFGADSFFMVDDQASSSDDEKTLADNARNLAILWGAINYPQVQ